MSTKTRIEQIVENRKPIAEKMAKLAAEWEVRKKKSIALGRTIAELSRIVSRKSPAGDSQFADALGNLAATLSGIEENGSRFKLEATASTAIDIITKLQQRFCRETVNMAAVGTGRCGKSTALKTLIGLEATDNSVIPSGDGPAVTAGKSEIHCVGSDEGEHAEIDFHTPESFLATIVNAPLNAMGLGEWECASLDDFAYLDIDDVAKDLYAAKTVAEENVRQIELSTTIPDKAQRLEEARSRAASYFRHEARLKTLRDVQASFKYFRDRLTGGTQKIELEEVGKFVSYPRNGSAAAVCFAVRQTRIYAHFPNPDAQGLVLTDLPGLGTMSDMEEKCFLDGMNYSIDAALVIRRPEGLFANYPTPEDARVRDSLSSIYGPARLPSFTIFFQNDGNLTGGGVESAFGQLSDHITQGTTILRGDASSRDYMQKTLLPFALEFVHRNVPKLDAALIDETSKPLAAAAVEFDTIYEAVVRELKAIRRLFPAGGGAGEIVRLAEDVRRSWTRDLVALQKSFADDNADNHDIVVQSEAITRLVEEAKSKVLEDFSPANSALVENLSVRIQQDHSVVPFVNRSLHTLRIEISEVFSNLQEVHDGLVADMSLKAAALMFAPLGELRPDTPTLAALAGILDKSGEAPELLNAVRHLSAIEIPFYTIVYPDLRREVFAQFEREQGRFTAIDSMPEDERAIPTLKMLENLGIQWISLAETLLRGQNRVREILAASVERFCDSVVRSEDTQHELLAFLEQNLASVHHTDDAGKSAVRAIIDRIAE